MGLDIGAIMENIEQIKITDLQSHPQQAEIYGDIELDEDFLLSIEDKGIIQPLIITYSELFGLNGDVPQYTIISGHRRYLGAKEKNIYELPCIIREYINQDEATLEFLISNKQRIKNHKQIVQEFLAYKQRLCQLGKLFLNKGLYKDSIYENEALSTLSEALKIDFEKPLDSIEILKNITGFSERQQKYLNLIYEEEKLDKLFQKWYSMGLDPKSKACDKIYDNWDRIRKACDNKEISYAAAYKQLSEYVELIEKGLLKNKKTKELKPAKEEPKALLLSPDNIVKSLCLKYDNKEIAKNKVDYQGEYKPDGLPPCRFGFMYAGEGQTLPLIQFDKNSYVIRWEILCQLTLAINKKVLK